MDVNDASQRKFKRIPIEIRCGIILGGTFHFAEAVSLSEGGMMLRVPLEIKVGETLEVQLAIDSKVICPTANAIYLLPRKPQSDDYFVGLKFSKIEFNDLRVIRSYVRHE